MSNREDILRLVAGQLFNGETRKWEEVDEVEEEHEQRNRKTFHLPEQLSSPLRPLVTLYASASAYQTHLIVYQHGQHISTDYDYSPNNKKDENKVILVNISQGKI